MRVLDRDPDHPVHPTDAADVATSQGGSQDSVMLIQNFSVWKICYDGWNNELIQVKS